MFQPCVICHAAGWGRLGADATGRSGMQGKAQAADVQQLELQQLGGHLGINGERESSSRRPVLGLLLFVSGVG